MNELPPVRKQQTSLGAFFKWATIGFLGFIAMILIFGAYLITRMFPLMEIGKNGASTKFFGGTLEVHEHDPSSSDETTGDKDSRESADWNGPGSETEGQLSRINGSLNEKLVAIAIDGVNGRLEIKAEKNAKPKFDCEVRSKGVVEQTDFIRDQAGESVGFKFDDDVRLSWCKLTLPESASVRLKLTNGDIELDEMRNPVNVEVTNGRITFDAAQGARYMLQAKTTNGMVMGREAFDEAQGKLSSSGTKNEIFNAKLNATNGVIIVE